jgi:hypothetical protein
MDHRCAGDLRWQSGSAARGELALHTGVAHSSAAVRELQRAEFKQLAAPPHRSLQVAATCSGDHRFADDLRWQPALAIELATLAIELATLAIELATLAIELATLAIELATLAIELAAPG